MGGEGVIDLTEEGCWFGGGAGEGADEGHGDGHEECGGDAFAGDVTEDSDELAVVVGEDFVEVTSNFAGGFEEGVGVEPSVLGRGGNIGGEDAELDFFRDTEFAGDFFLGGVGVGFGFEEGADAGFDFEDFERFGEVIVAAGFEALGFVFHVLECTEEHDGQVTSGGG
ncbi:MAG: hypothetical protein RI897_4108 [Verrucomicrobiota bacterium]